MKNILIIPSWYPTSDNLYTGIFVQEQAEALYALGLNISVFYSNVKSSLNPFALNSAFSLHKGKNIEVPTYFVTGTTLPKRSFILLNKWAKNHFKVFQEYLRIEGKPDIIHAHSFIGGFLAMKIGEAFDIPYIITEHHIEFLKQHPNLRYRKIGKLVFDNAERVIAVSMILKEKLQLLTDTSVVFIPNIVNGDIFNSNNISKTYTETVNLVCVANLEPYKHIERLLLAFQLLMVSSETKFKLTIVGDGSLKNKLKVTSKKLGIDKHITWIKLLGRTEIANLMRKSDIFVLPSDWETFGVVLIEAIACGLPVICTARGGAKEIINSSNGIYLLNASPKQLSDIILQMSIQLGDYKSMSMSNDILNIYGTTIVSQKIIENYNQIITDNY